MINIFGLLIPFFPFILGLVLLLTFFFQVLFYLIHMRVVLRNDRLARKGKLEYSKEQPPVSVIICARDETENLRKHLPEVLKQDYPNYEVIVVNDGGNEETEILLRDMKLDYPHLRSTFVPDGTTNISTKKLALTLGIKAARHEWLLFTDADCVPESTGWIAAMARNFLPGTDFVLGYGAYIEDKGFLSKLITYDTLFLGLQFLGFARKGLPYMGVGRNLAYRKSVFFERKGFASTLHLRSGDDDLMVNHAARKSNTRIETSKESITWSVQKTNLRSWLYQKERHLSVSVFYRSITKAALFIEPFTRGLFYLTSIAMFVWGALNLNYVFPAIALLLLLLRYLIQLLVLNKSSKYFGGRTYRLSLLLLDMILPLITLHIFIFGRMGKKSAKLNWK